MQADILLVAIQLDSISHSDRWCTVINMDLMPLMDFMVITVTALMTSTVLTCGRGTCHTDMSKLTMISRVTTCITHRATKITIQYDMVAARTKSTHCSTSMTQLQ